ncbi:hypothetical protein HUU05_24670 [candidate division KSB1 bacterium]|nr:hypothetical protein [candidate division KSB1 bacterium]
MTPFKEGRYAHSLETQDRDEKESVAAQAREYAALRPLRQNEKLDENAMLRPMDLR